MPRDDRGEYVEIPDGVKIQITDFGKHQLRELKHRQKTQEDRLKNEVRKSVYEAAKRTAKDVYGALNKKHFIGGV